MRDRDSEIGRPRLERETGSQTESRREGHEKKIELHRKTMSNGDRDREGAKKRLKERGRENDRDCES